MVLMAVCKVCRPWWKIEAVPKISTIGKHHMCLALLFIAVAKHVQQQVLCQYLLNNEEV